MDSKGRWVDNEYIKLNFMEDEQKVIVVYIGMNGESKKFQNAQEVKDYMYQSGYFYITTDSENVGLNDDNINQILSNAGNLRLMKTSDSKERAKAIGEAIIYLNPNLDEAQKRIIRNKFYDKELEDIKQLDLSCIRLEVLPESFGDLKQLEDLDLSGNKLTKLPESFGNLKDLQDLDLNDNKLTDLAESFGNLKDLQNLDLSDNQLTKLPESFGNLKSLRNLNLIRNGLTGLPESFGNLKSLHMLYLDGNELTDLLESFGGLKSLRVLSLRSNQLKELPRTAPTC